MGCDLCLSGEIGIVIVTLKVEGLLKIKHILARGFKYGRLRQYCSKPSGLVPERISGLLDPAGPWSTTKSGNNTLHRLGSMRLSSVRAAKFASINVCHGFLNLRFSRPQPLLNPYRISSHLPMSFKTATTARICEETREALIAAPVLDRNCQ